MRVLGFIGAISMSVLLFGCVGDVKTESAADFGLASGQTWVWFPGKVKLWQEYEEAESPSDLEQGDVRAIKRQHKHLQNSVARQLSKRGVRQAGDQLPTYYVAYYLFENGDMPKSRDYATYSPRPVYVGGDPEEVLLIDIVDPKDEELLWSGSGVGNTRALTDVGPDEPPRMRGVKVAVRHIMRDLK